MTNIVMNRCLKSARVKLGKQYILFCNKQLSVEVIVSGGKKVVGFCEAHESLR